MEIDRRGFFGRMIGGVVALVVGPKVIPVPESVRLLNEFDDWRQMATPITISSFEDAAMVALLRRKMFEAQNLFLANIDRCLVYRPAQLQLFPPHIPQVPLEDGWAAWEGAEQLDLFDDLD